MNVTWQANIGTDVVPIWITIPDNSRIHFSAAGGTPTLMRPIVRPDGGYVFPEECWIGPDVMLGGQRVINWVKPSAVTQKGKVFKVIFSEALTAAPIITAFDDINYSSWTIEALTGTEETNWTGLYKCFVTGSEAINTPPTTGWAAKETGGAGSRNPNSLQGNSQFVTVPVTVGAGGNFTFTYCPVIPSDCTDGKAGKYDPIIAVVYVHV